MSEKQVKRITNLGDPRTEIDGLGFFDYGVPRDVAVTEEQGRSLVGKGFTVEDPTVPEKSRKG